MYTLCRLPGSSNPAASRCRLLAASLRRPVYLLEFNQGYRQALVPYSRELSFTYLSGMSEIVSIAAFCKPNSNVSVIAVAYIKVGGGGGQCLNVYTVRENGGADLNGEGLAFSCSVEIDFIPYHLTHCVTSSNDFTIVLSGSDNRVHLFGEDSITHVAYEKPAGQDMPEFRIDFPSVVLWIEFHTAGDKFRLTCVGCECGFVALSRVCLKTGNVLDVSTANHGTSITSSRFFSFGTGIQLLVTSALLPATIYRNVETDGLKASGVSQTLQGSERHDVVTCSLICDIHMDGQPTILLGTYGQELLAYRWSRKDDHGETDESSWEMAWTKSFGHPILSLDYCDVTGDGVKELVAMTTRGVQVLQVCRLFDIRNIFLTDPFICFSLSA